MFLSMHICIKCYRAWFLVFHVSFLNSGVKFLLSEIQTILICFKLAETKFRVNCLHNISVLFIV